MTEELNLANLLKEQKVKPGFKLYSPMYYNIPLIFDSIDEDNNIIVKYDETFYENENDEVGQKVTKKVVFTEFNHPRIEYKGDDFKTLEKVINDPKLSGLWASSYMLPWEKFRYFSSVDKTLEQLVFEYLYYQCMRYGTYLDMAPKMQAIFDLCAVARGLDWGWKMKHDDPEEDKYYISLKSVVGQLYPVVAVGWSQYPSVCYFKTAEMAQEAIDKLGVDRIKLALL